MIKGVRLVSELKAPAPDRSVADAVLEMGRRSDAATKALLEAVKGLTPQVQVVHHETKQTVMAPIPVPRRRVFTVERDGAGLLSKVVANKLTFTVQRDADGLMTGMVVESKGE